MAAWALPCSGPCFQQKCASSLGPIPCHHQPRAVLRTGIQCQWRWLLLCLQLCCKVLMGEATWWQFPESLLWIRTWQILIKRHGSHARPRWAWFLSVFRARTGILCGLVSSGAVGKSRITGKYLLFFLPIWKICPQPFQGISPKSCSGWMQWLCHLGTRVYPHCHPQLPHFERFWFLFPFPISLKDRTWTSVLRKSCQTEEVHSRNHKQALKGDRFWIHSNIQCLLLNTLMKTTLRRLSSVFLFLRNLMLDSFQT